MEDSLRKKLTAIAKARQIKDDPSHDFQHILRVVNLAEKIAKEEKADLDIIIAAALFHDIIVYQKDTTKSKSESDESAEVAAQILSDIDEYPKEKIDRVKTSIKQCSFSKGIVPDLLESKILQDADRLEATGAISIMRTFASGGQMKRQFYDPKDPFCELGTVEFRSGLDFFYNRLLVVGKTMHTKYAKDIAKRRSKFLEDFLAQLSNELQESGII